MYAHVTHVVHIFSNHLHTVHHVQFQILWAKLYLIAPGQFAGNSILFKYTMYMGLPYSALHFANLNLNVLNMLLKDSRSYGSIWSFYVCTTAQTGTEVRVCN